MVVLGCNVVHLWLGILEDLSVAWNVVRAGCGCEEGNGKRESGAKQR